MKRLQQAIEYLRSSRFPFHLLVFAMTYQLLRDVTMANEYREVYDQIPYLFISGTVTICFMIYQIWKNSEYRLRNLLFVFFALDALAGVALVYYQVAVLRAWMIPLDILWLVGLFLLRYGKAERQAWQGITYREI